MSISQTQLSRRSRKALAGAAATIALGSILSIMGYEHLWNTTPTRHSAERASSATKRGARPRRKKA
jgi:hypothetical protein